MVRPGCCINAATVLAVIDSCRKSAAAAAAAAAAAVAVAAAAAAVAAAVAARSIVVDRDRSWRARRA